MAFAAPLVADLGLTAGAALLPEIIAAGASGAATTAAGLATVGSGVYGGIKAGQFAVKHASTMFGHKHKNQNTHIIDANNGSHSMN